MRLSSPRLYSSSSTATPFLHEFFLNRSTDHLWCEHGHYMQPMKAQSKLISSRNVVRTRSLSAALSKPLQVSGIQCSQCPGHAPAKSVGRTLFTHLSNTLLFHIDTQTVQDGQNVKDCSLFTFPFGEDNILDMRPFVQETYDYLHTHKRPLYDHPHHTTAWITSPPSPQTGLPTDSIIIIFFFFLSLSLFPPSFPWSDLPSFHPRTFRDYSSISGS